MPTLAVTLICSTITLLVSSCECNSKQTKTTGKDLPPTKSYGLTPEQASEVLVKVGDTTITLGDFAEKLGSQSPYLRARYKNPEKRREFLDKMVEFELLAHEARKRGYGKTPEVDRIRKQKMVQQMMKELFESDGLLMSTISEQEIEDYYNQHPDEFHKKEQVRASHIVFKGEIQAKNTLKRIKNEPENMKLFRELAEKHNTDPATRDRNGDLRFFSRSNEKGPNEPDVPDAVREAAFSIEKTGGVYPSLVKTPQGFHIVKLTAKRPGFDRTLDEARRIIQNRLWRKKREETIEKFVDELRQKAKVKENFDLLKQIKPEGASRDGENNSASIPPH